jgi:hypothetical protein
LLEPCPAAAIEASGTQNGQYSSLSNAGKGFTISTIGQHILIFNRHGHSVDEVSFSFSPFSGSLRQSGRISAQDVKDRESRFMIATEIVPV